MGEIVLFVWRWLPDWLADRLDVLCHLPFWKALAATVVVTLSVALFSASRGGFREKAKLVAAAAALGLLAYGLWRPDDLSFILG